MPEQINNTNFSELLSRDLSFYIIVAFSFLLLFLTAYIISSIRRWKVQKSIFNIDRNLEKLSNYICNDSKNVKPSDSTDSTEEKSKITFKK